MGGKESSDYLAPGPGENELIRCENGDYSADIEAAHGIPRPPEFPDSLEAPEEVETPGVTTIEELAEFLGIDEAATSKAMPVFAGERLVLALVRGDDRLSEEKLTTTLGSTFRPATDEEIRAIFGAGGGSLGPVAVTVEIIADEALREGQFVSGANGTDGTCEASRQAGTTRRLRRHPAGERGRRMSAVRGEAPVATRDRARPHLQARDVLLSAVRCELSR